MTDKNTLWEAMEHLSPDLIEAADAPAAPKRRRRAGKALLIAAAACLALAVGTAAAERLFGFRILEVVNSEEANYYRLQSQEITPFPVSQFSETVQDYMENGMPVLETRPADYVAEGSSGVVITYDIPAFDTWEEAAEFIGADIPLAEESGVLAEGEREGFSVSVTGNAVFFSAKYTLDGYPISLSANIHTEDIRNYSTGAYLGKGDMTTQQLELTTGSGDGALVYLTTGQQPACDAYFIHEGIYYNIFIEGAADTALMEEILASF